MAATTESVVVTSKVEKHFRLASTHVRICCLHKLKWPLRRSACPAAFSGAEIDVQKFKHTGHCLWRNFKTVIVRQEACSVSLDLHNEAGKCKIRSIGSKNAGHENEWLATTERKPCF